MPADKPADPPGPHDSRVAAEDGGSVDEPGLKTWLNEAAAEHGVPGVAMGVFHEGAEHYAFHGVTSVENPLEVDRNTIFCFGSTGKTFTATAVMVLCERGEIDLDAPVRTYVPELTLKDEACARSVTVLQLLNHTAGWQGDAFGDHGDGDDALGRFVASMADLDQVTPVGEAFSYNNAALDLAGHVIAKVTGKPYERAMQELVLDPLGLSNTFYFPNDVMTRRFAVGHRQGKDGIPEVRRPWAMSRAGAPSGGFGVSATAPDQIAWARFHLGDGGPLLPRRALERMREPTFQIPGSALGDAVGISWFLRDVDGVRTVSHGGDVLGQHSEFVMVPERDFAAVVLTNCDGSGSLLKDAAVRYALEAYLGVTDVDPEPVRLDDAALSAYTGPYETIAVALDISAHDGGLLLKIEIKPETLKALEQEGEEAPEQEPIPIAFLPGDGDRYVVTDGPAKGMKGYFVRDASGTVESVHVGGRLATRVKAGASV